MRAGDKRWLCVHACLAQLRFELVVASKIYRNRSVLNLRLDGAESGNRIAATASTSLGEINNDGFADILLVPWPYTGGGGNAILVIFG